MNSLKLVRSIHRTLSIIFEAEDDGILVLGPFSSRRRRRQMIDKV